MQISVDLNDSGLRLAWWCVWLVNYLRGLTLHRALHDGRPGFPGADGRLPIRPRCGRVYDYFHSFNYLLRGHRVIRVIRQAPQRPRTKRRTTRHTAPLAPGFSALHGRAFFGDFVRHEHRRIAVAPFMAPPVGHFRDDRAWTVRSHRPALSWLRGTHAPKARCGAMPESESDGHAFDIAPSRRPRVAHGGAAMSACRCRVRGFPPQLCCLLSTSWWRYNIP